MTLLTTAVATTAAAQDSTEVIVRPAKAPAAPAPLEVLVQPQTNNRWKVVVVDEFAGLTADPQGRHPLKKRQDSPPSKASGSSTKAGKPDLEPRPAQAARPTDRATLEFGEIFFVVGVHEPGGGRSPRLLLARFADPYGRKFEQLVGWCDSDSLLDQRQPLELVDARQSLLATLARPDLPAAQRDTWKRDIEQFLPVGDREESGRTTLKAVTQPTTKITCFTKPVPPAGEAQARAAGFGVSLQPFTFFYVYKAVAVAGPTPDKSGLFFLLAGEPLLELTRATRAEELRPALIGWLEIRHLIFWSTREALEYNLEPDARSARRRNFAPIELYRTRRHLEMVAKARSTGLPRPANIPPVWVEDFTEEYLNRRWSPQVMRYPILDRYAMGFDGGHQLSGFHACVLGKTGEEGALNLDSRALENYRNRVNSTLRNMRVLEIVLVLDRSQTMAGVLGPLKVAIKKLAGEFRTANQNSEANDLTRIEPRFAVVSYWDWPVNDPSKSVRRVTEHSGKFFDITNDRELTAFETYIDQLSCQGQCGPLREPFEGIRTAVDKFLANRSEFHSPGAARMVLVIGNTGNNDKLDGPPVRLDKNDVLAMLQRAAGGRVDTANTANIPKVLLYAVAANFSGGASAGGKAPSRAGQVAWREQMGYLAQQTGGESVEIDFAAGDPGKSPGFEKLREFVAGAVETNRDRLRLEIRAIQRLFTPTSDEDPQQDHPITRFARERVEEIIPGESLDAGRREAQMFFTNVHTIARAREDPAEHPRIQVCVLLTWEELSNLYVDCQRLVRQLETDLGSVRAEVGPERYRELMVQALITVLGDLNKTPQSRIKELANQPLQKIQSDIKRLPVVFGCLSGEPPTRREDIERVIFELRRVANGMQNILNNQKDRFFDPGIGTGTKHIWMYPNELP